MPQDNEYKFNSLEECENQDQAEEYYKERGWDILKQKVYRDGKCLHKNANGVSAWVKRAEKDYQCVLCGRGYLGVPDEQTDI